MGPGPRHGEQPEDVGRDWLRPRDAQRMELEVREFVSAQLKCPLEQLRLDMDLCAELGLYGDDVDEFFIAFAERFKLPLGALCGLDLTGCFPGEGTRLLAFRPTHRVRVRHLIQAAKRGVWPSTEQVGVNGERVGVNDNAPPDQR